MRKFLTLLLSLLLFAISGFAEDVTEMKDGSKFIGIEGHKHYFKKFEKRADGKGYDRVIVDLRWLYEKCKELEKEIEKFKSN